MTSGSEFNELPLPTQYFQDELPKAFHGTPCHHRHSGIPWIRLPCWTQREGLGRCFAKSSSCRGTTSSCPAKGYLSQVGEWRRSSMAASPSRRYSGTLPWSQYPGVSWGNATAVSKPPYSSHIFFQSTFPVTELRPLPRLSLPLRKVSLHWVDSCEGAYIS